MRYKFRKEQRLAQYIEFRRTIKHGQKIVNKYFVVYFLKNDKNYSRLGISVTRKLGIAVVRNRVKRLIRESFRVLQNSMNANYDFIIIPRYDFSNDAQNMIYEELMSICQRAQII